jgi:hypothetical protein
MAAAQVARQKARLTRVASKEDHPVGLTSEAHLMLPEPIFSIDQALPQLSHFLDRLRSDPHAFDDPRRSAVRAVWRAVDQTRMHLASIKSGHGRRDKANPELVQLWSDAALDV